MTEESLFHQALEQPAEQRAAFLERACGDEAMRRRLEALLHAHDHPASFLAQPPVNPAGVMEAPPPPDGSPHREGPGDHIGAYKLLQRIGEGGMGAVWMAEQTRPVQRTVALKIIKPGMDSDRVIARFEAERQALALMDHPHIARVFDAGTTEGGRPFFVMELVKGVPITRFCDERRLTLRQRLELFIPVCRAVQHAHQKGIIHRDLKPSNVLVALYDGQPVPKVIDFGVAKATGPKLTEKTLFTEFGQVIGTLEYMSPEQAELNNLDIDTRSDVYALGVLLYELLTGTTPLSPEALKEKSILEVLRLIREEDPPTPSNRLSTTKELASIAASRGVEPRQLSGQVRGELDWIVMKALEKDRGRRYETANGLAQDVERYLADEPVQACPPSSAYRLRKFARRHQVGFAFAGLLLLFLVVFGAGLGWVVGDRSARQQVRHQEADHGLGQAARCLEQGQWSEATAWVQRAEGALAGGAATPAVRQRLQGARADLEMVADVHEIRVRQSEVRDDHFDNQAADPEFARAFQKYGIDVEALGVEEAAAAIRARPIRLELVLALDDWAALRRLREGNSWRHLLTVARAADADDFRNELRRALTQQRVDRAALERLAAADGLGNLPAPTLVLLAKALRHLGALPEALAVGRQAQQRYPNDFWANHDLGFCLVRMQPPRWQEALPFYMAALGLRPESPGVRVNLGHVLNVLGDFDGSVAVLQEAIRRSPNYATAYRNRAFAYLRLGRRDRAIADYSKVVELQPDFREAWIARGALYSEVGEFDRAVADYTRALDLKQEDATVWNSRGDAHRKLRQFDKALADFDRSLDLKPDDARGWNNRGMTFLDRGQPEKALPDFSQAIQRNPAYAEAWCNRAAVYLLLEHPDRALDDCNKALDRRPDYVEALTNRGDAYRRLLQPERALDDLDRAVKLRPDFAPAWFQRGNAYRALNQYDKAAADFGKVVELKPEEVEAWNNRGHMYRLLGETDKALADFDQALKLKPDLVQAWNNRGLGHQQLQQWDKAIADFTKAVDLKPASPGIQRNLAWLLATCPEAKLRAPGRAVEAAKKAVELDPRQATSWNTLGAAHYRAGDWQAAVAALEKSVELRRGGNGYDLFFLAMARWQLGDRADARRWYDRAVRWLEQHRDAVAKDAQAAEELRRFRAEAVELLQVRAKEK
jgi:tetratricopeptide (TPR) repeat protein/serine/threonine protein kinase